MSKSDPFGVPTLPLEFPLKARALEPDGNQQVGLYECSICRALVLEENAQPHADWHAGERMRNFGGF